MLGIEELSAKDRQIVLRARRLQVAGHSGIAGVSVTLEETLRDCDGFLTGKYDELDEAQCYMRGAMREGQQ